MEDTMPLQAALREQFDGFRRTVDQHSGAEFQSFDAGLAQAWEGYKIPLRAHALSVMKVNKWSEELVGSGEILGAVIDAIELDVQGGPMNNLVAWQNRFGHANRSHRALLEARDELGLRTRFEQVFLGLYTGQMEEREAFEELLVLSGKRYDLLGYLFFLRDHDRFMPIRPRVFDEAFDRLGIDLVTARRCSWENYSHFNETLEKVRDGLTTLLGSPQRLIDGHSFCWMLVKLEEHEPLAQKAKRSKWDPGRLLSARERSIFEMCRSVQQTVSQGLGPPVEKTPKPKELRMSTERLRDYITQLVDRQEGRCALTGIELQWRGEETDPQLLPSLDRIDSDRHYEAGNLQVVCRFLNFWKGSTDDEEFRRLLALVRGLDI